MTRKISIKIKAKEIFDYGYIVPFRLGNVDCISTAVENEFTLFSDFKNDPSDVPLYYLPEHVEVEIFNRKLKKCEACCAFISTSLFKDNICNVCKTDMAKYMHDLYGDIWDCKFEVAEIK